jgi:serine/threonine protein kinase
LDYAENGSLRNYLDTNKRSWSCKIDDLYHIACGLNRIHKNELIHRDLHIGNILKTHIACITDMGLCKPADYNDTKKSIYGVLPYVAPEILRGQNYTFASDIYSFGIIMYEVFSGLPPYHDISHNENLAIKICSGLRPRFNIKVPQLFVNLIKRCLDANPSIRPTAYELQDILNQLYDYDYRQTEKGEELKKQIKEADEINKNLSTTSNSSPTTLSYETHTEAIYTSRLLNFNNLPESKNSDDYYEQNDNVISKEFSGD